MIYDIILNMEKSGIKPRIKVSQYDDSVPQIRATLYSQNQPYTPPANTTAYISGTKADNTGFKYECTVSGNTVTADVTQQMTAFSGDVECEFTFEAQGVRKGTENFILEVENTALADDIIVSESDIPALARLGQIATTERLGVVKVDGTSVTIDADGTLHSSASGSGTVKKVNGQSPDASGEVTITTANISDNASKRFVSDTEKQTWNGKSDFSGSYTDLTNKPTIPDELADLQDDSTHRLVTDTEKSAWDGKSVVSFRQTQHTGTEVGELTIDGVATKLFAPNGGSGGGGDMLASTYDPNGDVANAGGIPSYVSAHAGGGAKPNLNLLSNGWFKVNTTGTVATKFIQYGNLITNWKTYTYGTNNNTITRNSDGSFTFDTTVTNNDLNNIYQDWGKSANWIGQSVTLSIKLSDGTIYQGSATITSASALVLYEDTTFKLWAENVVNNARVTVQIKAGNTVTIRAVKLEFGTESTLAYDTEPIGLTDIISDGDTSAITSNAVYDAQEIMAKHEDGSTSSKAYAIGDYFIRGGKYCKCISAIASGGTFTKNTNYTETDIGSQLVAKADADQPLFRARVYHDNAYYVKISGLKPTTSGWNNVFLISCRHGAVYLLSWSALNNAPYVEKLCSDVTRTTIENDRFYYEGTDVVFRFGYQWCSVVISQLNGYAVSPTITTSSTNPLTNPTIITTNDLTNKQDALTFTSTPSASNKVVALQDLSIANCQDTQLTTPSNGQILKYNGSAWVNANESGGSTTSGTFTAASGVSGNLDVKQYGNVVNIYGYVYSFNGSISADTTVSIGTISGVSLKTLTTTCLTNSQGATTCGDCSQISITSGAITLIPKAARYNGWECWIDITYIV